MGPALPRLGRLALTAFDFALSDLFQTQCLGCGVLCASPLCERCHWFPKLAPVPGAPVQSALVYQEPWRTVLHAIKFGRNAALLRLFRDLIRDADFSFVPPQGVVIPVPLHASTFRKRKFNQSEVLARWVARAADRRLLSDGLVKAEDTPAQSTLDRDARLDNLSRCFQWVGKSAAPRQVLLVDDVYTTGATLAACSDALVHSGAREILIWTLFRAGGENFKLS